MRLGKLEGNKSDWGLQAGVRSGKRKACQEKGNGQRVVKRGVCYELRRFDDSYLLVNGLHSADSDGSNKRASQSRSRHEYQSQSQIREQRVGP